MRAAEEVDRSALIRVLNGPTDPPGPPVVVGDFVDFGATLPSHTGALLDNGSQGATSWVSIPDQPRKLTFDWWAANARGVANGGIRIRQHQGGATAEVRTLDNDLKVVDQFRLGALWGVVAGSEGHLYFDVVTVTF